MKRSLVLALTLVAGACTTAQNVATDDVDKARMSAVERSASDRGVKIYWVNPPHKAAATQSGG